MLISPAPNTAKRHGIRSCSLSFFDVGASLLAFLILLISRYDHQVPLWGFGSYVTEYGLCCSTFRSPSPLRTSQRPTLGSTQLPTYDRHPRLARWASPRVIAFVQDFLALTNYSAHPDLHSAPTGATTYPSPSACTRKLMMRAWICFLWILETE